GERGSDIDHVVIGPVGVFTVNAKHHPKTSVWGGGDTFMVNGQRVPYVRNSRHEAKRAGRLLSEQSGFPVAVLGVIAVMGAHKGFKIKKQPEDGAVVIVQRRRIAQYVQGLPRRMTEQEIEAIYDVARRSTTWN
ncbi:MAG: nuclease-related domain-containing protein, partial [Marmoricola sp.]